LRETHISAIIRIPVNHEEFIMLGTPLPDALRAERIDDVAVLTLARPEKRNALSDEAVLGIERFFDGLEPDVRAVVIDADGDFLYVATRTSPGQVVKVNLATFARVTSTPFAGGEDNPNTAVIDPQGRAVYYGLSGSPGQVVTVTLDPSTVTFRK
jgi:hypothetical protein